MPVVSNSALLGSNHQYNNSSLCQELATWKYTFAALSGVCSVPDPLCCLFWKRLLLLEMWAGLPAMPKALSCKHQTPGLNRLLLPTSEYAICKAST